MNAEKATRKWLIPAALQLAVELCLSAAGLRLVHQRAHADAAQKKRRAAAEQRLASALQRITQLREAGAYPAARSLLNAMLPETEAAFGAQSLEVATALNQLG